MTTESWICTDLRTVHVFYCWSEGLGETVRDVGRVSQCSAHRGMV